VKNTGRLQITSDTAIGKILPVPKGRGEKGGPYFVVGLECGPAMLGGLRVVWPLFGAQRWRPIS
jgi:hypothetical protein